MAAIDDAVDVVAQRKQDSGLVRTMLDGMAAHMASQAPRIDPTPGIEGNLAAKPGPAPTADPAAATAGQGETGDLGAALTAVHGDLASFMGADTATESGGNPNAVNARTGASGTFQIMPSNWASWAKEAGVDPADHSPEAQQKVAAHKMQSYYDQFGSWGAVAVAWYAGPSAAQHWLENPQAPMYNKGQGPNGSEPSINAYVSQVLGAMKARTGG